MGGLTMKPEALGNNTPARVRAQLYELAERQCELLVHKEKAWASIAFAGTRHTLELQFKGSEAVEAGERFVAALPEHEFRIVGQLVAEAAVTESDHHFAEIETLTVTAVLLLLEET